jgi:inner membrane transporter RhtA
VGVMLIARSSKASAVSLLLCSVASLQFGAALSTRLFPTIGPAGASLLRLGLSSAVLLVLTRPSVRLWTRGQWASVLVLGVAMAGMNGLFYEALARLPLGIAVTVEFLGPLVLAAALSRQRRELMWVAMALLGVAVLGLTRHAGGGALSITGLLFAAVAGVFWALYVLVGSTVASEGIGLGALAVATGVAALIVAPAGAGSGGAALLSPSVLGIGLLVAVLACVIPYSCELTALAALPRQTFSVLLALEPAAAAIIGAVLLGQILSPVQSVAIALVVAAGIGSTLAVSPSRQQHDGKRRERGQAHRGAREDHAPSRGRTRRLPRGTGAELGVRRQRREPAHAASQA